MQEMQAGHRSQIVEDGQGCAQPLWIWRADDEGLASSGLHVPGRVNHNWILKAENDKKLWKDRSNAQTESQKKRDIWGLHCALQEKSW